MSARDGVSRSIVEDSSASLGPSLKDLVENLRAALNKSAEKAYCAGSIISHFHAVIAIDDITVRLSEGAASDDGDASTKDEDVVDPQADLEVIEL